VENRFYEFLSRFEEVDDRTGIPPAWLLRVKEHLDDTIKEAYSVRSLAGEAGVHPVHLARTFRRYLGCTVQEYVRLRRVREMADRLIYSRKSAWHLALENGFADGAYATRSFRKVLGTTPSRYRRIFLPDV
jgi:AraC family transcriptional regulator